MSVLWERALTDLSGVWLPPAPWVDGHSLFFWAVMGTGESDTCVVFSGQLQKLSLLDLENGNIGLGGDSFLSCHLHTSFYCIYYCIT